MAGNNATRKEQNNPALLKIKTDQSQQTCTFWVLQAINQFQQSRSITLGSQKNLLTWYWRLVHRCWMSVTPDNNRTSQNFFSQKKNRLHSQMLLLLLKPLTEKIVAVFQCRELFVLFFFPWSCPLLNISMKIRHHTINHPKQLWEPVFQAVFLFSMPCSVALP